MKDFEIELGNVTVEIVLSETQDTYAYFVSEFDIDSCNGTYFWILRQDLIQLLRIDRRFTPNCNSASTVILLQCIEINPSSQ